MRLCFSKAQPLPEEPQTPAVLGPSSCPAALLLPVGLTLRSNFCSILRNTTTSIHSSASPVLKHQWRRRGRQKETLNRMEESKGKNWPGAKLFQAKESHLVSKCWTAKQTWFQFVEGGERRGKGKGRRREGGGGPVGPNSHAKTDFLLCPNCISTGSFFSQNNRNERA